MKFLRTVKGVQGDFIRKDTIREDLGAFAINDKLKEYLNNWHHPMDRMREERFLKLGYNYILKGRRDVGKSRKRWCVTVEQALLA